MSDEALLSRYLKVKALVERGVPGEQKAARVVLDKMESEHPGIRVQAERFRRKKEAEAQEASAPHPQPKSKPKREAPPGVWYKDEEDEPKPWEARGEQRGGNWENLFQNAWSAAKTAYGFAETISNAIAGRDLAEELQIGSRMTNSGHISISLKLPLAAYQQVLGLNAIQRAAFRQALHEKLDVHLDRLFGDS
jgi:hypothetical protein